MKTISSILTLALTFSLAFISPQTQAQVIRIEVGDKSGSSKDALERRVWDLERAVRQLQNRIFDLEADKGRPSGGKTTCTISSMGKVHMATEDTEMLAKSVVLKKCADATNAIHCEKSDVECGK